MGRCRSPRGHGRKCAVAAWSWSRHLRFPCRMCVQAARSGRSGRRSHVDEQRTRLGVIGRRISEALAVRGIRRGKTLVAVSRANIELKNLALPPSPADELPELVRFQAEREFNTLTDDWPLDFIPLPSETGEALAVLAAAISPELVGEIQITCQAANLTPSRLILRPCAAASLLSRCGRVTNKNYGCSSIFSWTKPI